MFSAFLGPKNHLFQKVLKKWSSIQKNRKYSYHFLGGGVRPQSDKDQFFLSLPLQMGKKLSLDFLKITSMFFYLVRMILSLSSLNMTITQIIMKLPPPLSHSSCTCICNRAGLTSINNGKLIAFIMFSSKLGQTQNFDKCVILQCSDLHIEIWDQYVNIILHTEI